MVSLKQVAQAQGAVFGLNGLAMIAAAPQMMDFYFTKTPSDVEVAMVMFAMRLIGLFNFQLGLALFTAADNLTLRIANTMFYTNLVGMGSFGMVAGFPEFCKSLGIDVGGMSVWVVVNGLFAALTMNAKKEAPKTTVKEYDELPGVMQLVLINGFVAGVLMMGRSAENINMYWTVVELNGDGWAFANMATRDIGFFFFVAMCVFESIWLSSTPTKTQILSAAVGWGAWAVFWIVQLFVDPSLSDNVGLPAWARWGWGGYSIYVTFALFQLSAKSTPAKTE